ncbi:ML2, partial [Symbiodinium pilosum]
LMALSSPGAIHALAVIAVACRVTSKMCHRSKLPTRLLPLFEKMAPLCRGDRL